MAKIKNIELWTQAIQASMNEFPSQPSEDGNKVDEVYGIIKFAILCSKFPSGMIVSERVLAEVLHVSRSPVRESLKRLVREGLLVSNESGTISIPTIRYREIIELYNLLEQVEVYTLERVIPHAGPDLIQRLEDILKEYEVHCSRHSLFRTVWMDYEFHTTIARMAIFRRIEPMVFPMYGQRVQVMCALIEPGDKVLEEIQELLRALLRATQERDVILSKQVIRQYTQRMTDFCQQKLEGQQTD